MLLLLRMGIGMGIDMDGRIDGWMDGWVCGGGESVCGRGSLGLFPSGPYVFIIELRMTTFSALCFAASELQLICQPLKSIKI